MSYNAYKPDFERGFKETFLRIFPDGEVDLSKPMAIEFKANGIGAMVHQEKKYEAWLEVNKIQRQKGQPQLSPNQWGVELAKVVAQQLQQPAGLLQKSMLDKLSIDTISIGLLPAQLTSDGQAKREVIPGLFAALAYEDGYVRQYLGIEDLESIGLDVTDERVWKKAEKRTMHLQFSQQLNTQMMGALNIMQMDNLVTRLMFPKMFGNHLFIRDGGTKKLGSEDVVYVTVDQNTLIACAPEDISQALIMAPMAKSGEEMWPVLFQLAFRNGQLFHTDAAEKEMSIEKLHETAKGMLQKSQPESTPTSGEGTQHQEPSPEGDTGSRRMLSRKEILEHAKDPAVQRDIILGKNPFEELTKKAKSKKEEKPWWKFW